MILVTTSDWNAVEGRLRRYERTTVDEKWRPAGDPISIVVGRNGLGWGIGVIATDDVQVRSAGDPVKREGDGKSPAGVFALSTAFGYASEPLRGLKMPYLSLTPSIECVDDPGSKHYNRIVDGSVVAPDWNSSEHMRNAGESYRWGVVVDHNGTVTGQANPPKPGGDSCVFLHTWHSQDQATVGCTAMSQANLETLLTWLDPASKPLLVQLPEAGNASPVLNALIGGWHVSGIFRWTSGFPITVDNGFTWATNWNIEGDAMPNGPAPKASNPKNAMVNGQVTGPDIFADPANAEAAFRPEWPGESGVRNNVIGEGMFNIDTGVSKDFSLGEKRRLEFSWQAFNATNSVRYDVRGEVGNSAQPGLSEDPTQFGKYLSTLTTPRFMQFVLRFVF
jgi:L,D-peptidoglycan transpeptidase YkuD (ErfK/YbiS/YcfS/YnhG family)